jgi:hypothetical protein
MDIEETLQLLEAIQGDPAKLALATVDLKYPGLSETERGKLKQALEAAAIPHWCDEVILAGLLEIPVEESASRLTQLSKLKVLEPFPARGETAWNVREYSRLALRLGMANALPDRFRMLSARAAKLFEVSKTPSGQIEKVYHLLCADPERGADQLEHLDRGWTKTSRSKERNTLVVALARLQKREVVAGERKAAKQRRVGMTRQAKNQKGPISLRQVWSKGQSAEPGYIGAPRQRKQKSMAAESKKGVAPKKISLSPGRTSNFLYDVFLSYSSKDKLVVRDIAERLRKDGLKVWFDEWVFKPGDAITAKIDEGLEQSRVLVLCMSANAFGSDWTKLESGVFRFRDPLNKACRLVPLRLDDTPIKGWLAQLHYVNWLPEARKQEYAQLLQAVRR